MYAREKKWPIIFVNSASFAFLTTTPCNAETGLHDGRG